MRKLIFPLLLLLTCFRFAFAQSGVKISGRLADSLGNPVQSAIITLTSAADSIAIKSTYSDAAGRFTINSVAGGNYRVRVNLLGYQKHNSAVLTIGAGDIDLKQIILFPRKTTLLKEVVISGKKPFVERKIDRTVVNVDALATNQGISAFDVLEKSPGILIDPANGNISLEGKQGATVYIDDKKSNLTGADLAAYLQSLPSGSLDRIELMTNPPARYDAAGSGGIINIRLKKNKVKGFNGGLTLLFGQWRYGKTEERFNFNYRTGKFNIFGSFGNNQQNYSGRNYQDRQYLNPDGSRASYFSLYNFTHGRGHTLVPQLGVDFYQSDKTTWGILFSDVYRPINNLGQTTSTISNQANQPDSSINQYFNNQRVFRTGRINLNYRHQYDKNGHELTADFDYNSFRISNNQLFNNVTTLPDQQVVSQGQETGTTPSNIHIYALKADYSHPLRDGFKLETGIKTSFTNTDNPASYFNIINDASEPDYSKTNHFLYDENINAAYINASKDWKKLSAQFGLRLENTNLKGHQLGNSVERDSSFKNNYTSLFPTFYLQYKLDSANVNQFGFNYGRRINRPFYQDLNPFIIPQDKFNYDVGNPYLKPSFTQSLELSYIYKNNLTVKLFYNRNSGDIQVVNHLEDGILFSTLDNLGYDDEKGISVGGSFNPVKWFVLTGFASFKFQHTQTLSNNNMVNIYGNIVFLNGNAQFKMGRGWNAELNGFFQSKNRNFQYTQKGVGRVNAVFQKKISNNFTTKLVFTDFLGLFKYEGIYNTLPLTNATYKNTFDTRGFNISLIYRFGKAIKDLRNHQNNASGDEQGRVKN